MAATVTRKDNTREVLTELQRRQLSFVTQGGQAIQANAKVLLSRVDTGNLRNSIITTSFVEDGVPTSETGPTAEYAVYIEYGTGIYASPEGPGSRAKKIPWVYYDERTGQFRTTYGMKAEPFMEPGFQAALPTIDRLRSELAV
jgi:HK97 gp10 family phage protein